MKNTFKRNMWVHPVSSATQSGAYWRNTSPITVYATASDTLSGVKDVKLYYRYRPNNGTAWPNDWTFFGTDSNSVDGWSWAFPWRYSGVDGVQGHYQFHTIATDNAGNVEAAPSSPDPDFDAGYGYDCTPPDTPALLSPSDGWSFTTTSVKLDWSTCYDTPGGSGMSHYVVYLSGGGSTTSWTVTDSQKTVSSLNYGTTYSWWVRAVDNAVGVRIYEDSILIHSADVTRTAGEPDIVTLELNRYLGRVYDIELVYEATHRGANPTWLEFSSRGASLTYFKEFNTKDGFSQAITVPSSYLDDVTASNPTFHFDASGSYDMDGCIVSYEWNFGDGTVAQGIIAEHTYAAPGTYEATLTVTDEDGAVAKETVFVEVR